MTCYNELAQGDVMKIITDTGSMLTLDQTKAMKVELIPLQVELKGKNYRDYFEIDAQTFMREVQDGVPQSSQPAIGDVIEIFDKVKDGLYVAMTSGLSSTYVSAAGIQQQPEYKDILVFNSKTLAGSQSYLVEVAAKLAAKKLSKEEIVSRLEACTSECKSYLIPVDFDYLKRNGRLSGVAAMMSGLLKIKPIVYHKPGLEKIEKFGVGRTYHHAIESIMDDMKKANVGTQHVIHISHANNLEVAQMFAKRITEHFPGIETHVLELSPVMITQGGPGCVAVQYVKKDID
jgi:DegV family protein with EDD domain